MFLKDASKPIHRKAHTNEIPTYTHHIIIHPTNLKLVLLNFFICIIFFFFVLCISSYMLKHLYIYTEICGNNNNNNNGWIGFFSSYFILLYWIWLYVSFHKCKNNNNNNVHDAFKLKYQIWKPLLLSLSPCFCCLMCCGMLFVWNFRWMIGRRDMNGHTEKKKRKMMQEKIDFDWYHLIIY